MYASVVNCIKLSVQTFKFVAHFAYFLNSMCSHLASSVKITSVPLVDRGQCVLDRVMATSKTALLDLVFGSLTMT